MIHFLFLKKKLYHGTRWVPTKYHSKKCNISKSKMSTKKKNIKSFCLLAIEVKKVARRAKLHQLCVFQMGFFLFWRLHSPQSKGFLRVLRIMYATTLLFVVYNIFFNTFLLKVYKTSKGYEVQGFFFIFVMFHNTV